MEAITVNCRGNVGGLCGLFCGTETFRAAQSSSSADINFIC
jgi:hypothetical protein